MREPSVSLVEFISSKNCHGGFGRIDRRGFEISKWKMFDRQNNGLENMVEVDKDQVLGGNFLRERNKSQIKDHLVQRK